MKIYKSQPFFWVGSGHPNFMNPYEYGTLQISIRVSPVQSGRGPQQSPVFSSISNFYCRRKFLKVILTREYFDGII